MLGGPEPTGAQGTKKTMGKCIQYKGRGRKNTYTKLPESYLSHGERRGGTYSKPYYYYFIVCVFFSSFPIFPWGG